MLCGRFAYVARDRKRSVWECWRVRKLRSRDQRVTAPAEPVAHGVEVFRG